MTKNLKTPLRYPGGKSRALTKLLKYLPQQKITEYREMFLGGGSVALEMTKCLPNDVPIWVNDLYGPLYNFWIVLRDNPIELQRKLVELKSRYPDRGNAKGLFLEAKDIVNDGTKVTRKELLLFTFLISVVSLVLLNLPPSLHRHPIQTSQCEAS